MAGSGYAPQAMIPGVSVRVGGAFAEYTRSLGHGMALSAGGRIDTARSEADSTRANMALYEAYQGTASLTDVDTLPAAKVRLAWRRGAWEFAGGVGHAARVPEATERYLALRRMGTDWVGNPDLAPSRNTGLDAAIGFTRAGFRFDLGLYASRVSVFDRFYTESLSYQRDPFRSGVRVPEPGRSLFANASFRF